MGPAINVALFLGNTEYFLVEISESNLGTLFKKLLLSLIPWFCHLRTPYFMQQNNIPVFHKAIPTHTRSAHHSPKGSLQTTHPVEILWTLHRNVAKVKHS